MTTAVKPLPPHGSYARANGSPGRRAACNCDPCRETRLRAKKRIKVNKELGRPGRIPADKARTHLQLLRQTMTWSQIAKLAGRNELTLREIHSGSRTMIRRTTQNGILAIRPQAVTEPGKYIDATGSRRRIQALRAIGYSPVAIAASFGFSETHVRYISSGKYETVRHRIALRVATAYTALATQPAPNGASATMARNYAKTHGWAPPGAWDDDTIADPDASAEWTGHCGTDRGWWTHSLNDIPVCPRCEAAHNAWKAERAHLSPSERWSEIGKARAAASNRGATIAADARELFGYGVTVEQAAERLGVTRQHLQQELLRHPADEAVAA